MDERRQGSWGVAVGVIGVAVLVLTALALASFQARAAYDEQHLLDARASQAAGEVARVD